MMKVYAAMKIRSTLAPIVLVLFLASQAWASIPSDTAWEVRTTGSDTTCSGGFSNASKGATGVDYSQQAAAQYTYTTDLSGSGTTTLTSAGSHFTNDILGNVINITGQGFYCVTAFTSTSTVTVDRNLGTFSSATGYVGGALASPGQAAGAMTNSNSVYIKAGTYTLAGGTANTAGNKVSTSSSGTLWQGYNSSRGDGGTKPVFQAGANSLTIFATGNVDIVVENLEFNLNGHTTITALTLGNSRNIARAVKITSADSIGINVTGANCLVYQCEVTGVTGGNAAIYSTGGGNRIVQNYSHGNSVAGFRSNSNQDNYVDDLSYNNAGHGFQAATGCYYQNCTAHGNTGSSISGFELGSSNNCILDHCLSTSNGTGIGGYGFDTTGTGSLLFNCAAQGNFTADTNGTYRVNVNFQSLSGGPYVSAGTNFGLNNTSGAGAKARGLTWTPPGLSTTTAYTDGGVAQSQSTSGPNNIGYIMAPTPERPSSPASGLVAGGLLLAIAIVGVLASKLLLRKPRA